jgi:hypothetical protein
MTTRCRYGFVSTRYARAQTSALIGIILLISCGREATSHTAATSPVASDTMKRTRARIPYAAEVEALAVEGASVYGRLITTYDFTGMYLVGGVDLSGQNDPPAAALQFAMPADAWNRLTSREKTALSYFIESQVPIVRLHPHVYSLDPASAPLWPNMQRAFQSICDTCWSIKLGRYAPAEGGVVSAERTVIAGDEYGSQTIFGKPETTASEMRRNTLSRSTPTLTWRVERLDPTVRYTIDLEAASTFDSRSGLYIHQTPADLAGAWRTK